MTLRSPFTKDIPLARWHGQKNTILQLPSSDEGAEAWILFPYYNPNKCLQLTIRTNNKSEKLFFDLGGKKFYKVTSDALYWSYYNAGPFQKMETGVWIDIDPTRKVKEEEIQDICSRTGHFKFNTVFGTMEEVEILDDENEKEKEEAANQEEKKPEVETKKVDYGEMAKDLREKIRKSGDLQKKKKDNQETWNECAGLLEKLNKNGDFISWKEAIIKGDDEAIPNIKSNQIVKIFEEILDLYGMMFEVLQSQLNVSSYASANYGRPMDIFPVDSMNDVKFVMGVILPDICLYPKSFITDFCIKKIKFGGMFVGREDPGIIVDHWLYLNTTERNIMKLQRAFHEHLFHDLLRQIRQKVPEFDTCWCATNVPDFAYDATRKKMPKGLKGFLTLNAVLRQSSDMDSIYFGLIKDPKTVLEHSDIIIAKKAHLLKTVLSEVCPEMDDSWWEKVQGYKDIFEMSLKSLKVEQEEEEEENDEESDKKNPAKKKEGNLAE